MERIVKEDDSVCGVICECVAAETGRDVLELEPFADSIDTDVIAAFFDQSDGQRPRRLSVEYEGCRVTIDEDVVRVHRIAESPSA